MSSHPMRCRSSSMCPRRITGVRMPGAVSPLAMVMSRPSLTTAVVTGRMKDDLSTSVSVIVPVTVW